MENLRSKDVTINGEVYTIPFPNVGQSMRIEMLKMSFSSGKYPQMIDSEVKSIIFNLELIDSISFFSVLIPDFHKKMKVENIAEMDLASAKEFIRAYKKEFYPWFNPIMEGIMEFDDLKKDEKSA